MQTVEQMIRVTPTKWKENAKQVILIKVKKAVRIEKDIFFFLEMRTKVDSYETTITLYNVPPGRLTKAKILKAKASVSCECPAHKYYAERALHDKGSSPRKFTRGIEPGSGPTGMEVNPKGIPWVCKHVIKAFANLHKMKLKPKGRLTLEQEMAIVMKDIDDHIPEKYDRKRTKKIKVKKKRK